MDSTLLVIHLRSSECGLDISAPPCGQTDYELLVSACQCQSCSAPLVDDFPLFISECSDVAAFEASIYRLRLAQICGGGFALSAPASSTALPTPSRPMLDPDVVISGFKNGILKAVQGGLSPTLFVLLMYDALSWQRCHLIPNANLSAYTDRLLEVGGWVHDMGHMPIMMTAGQRGDIPLKLDKQDPSFAEVAFARLQAMAAAQSEHASCKTWVVPLVSEKDWSHCKRLRQVTAGWHSRISDYLDAAFGSHTDTGSGVVVWVGGKTFADYQSCSRSQRGQAWLDTEVNPGVRKLHTILPRLLPGAKAPLTVTCFCLQ